MSTSSSSSRRRGTALTERRTTVAVLGVGEAGSAFVADLLAAGAVVRAYDPAVAPPAGVVGCADEAEAVTGADLVLSVNSSADSLTAATNAAPGLAAGAVWAEANSSAPARKQEVAGALPARVSVADLALMSTVPGLGLRVPMVASGAGAVRLAALLAPLGASVSVVAGDVGAAASRKLLRSIFYKGLAAAVVESLEAARAAGLEPETRTEIARELERATAETVDRLVRGSVRHAERRSHEMAAAGDMLHALGVPDRVARASQEWLEDLSRRAQA
jgi:3-hydroxyisobutyrate dehydrogenase-like beta-hydroxyacid dehydrogenase